MVSAKITATVSTKGRFRTTFPLMLTSVINQTLKPCRLIIYDDNEKLEDLRDDEVYRNLFMLMDKQGIKWEVKMGGRKGQVFNHQQALKDVDTEWIWRLDDDNIMEPNVLQYMFEYADPISTIGAVGPLILDPKSEWKHSMASNKIEDIFLGLNIQWINTNIHSYIHVDHLQGSTFLFRKKAAEHGYESKLSKVGHREETIFTYEMKRKGWELVVLTGAKTWHMRYGAGGIRSTNEYRLFENDEHIFRNYIRDWKINTTKIKVIPLDSGIGDHYAFRMALPDIKKRYKDHLIVIGSCYDEVFEGETGIKLISLTESSAFVRVEDYNIYQWMDKNNWKISLMEAYKTMHTK